MDTQAKIITQFVRDLSFENPQGPMAFRSQTQKPEIKANIDVKAINQKDTKIYEIELNINVSALQNDKNVYLIDLKYVGIFEIENLTDEIREPYLLVECPRLIFPFARRIIYDLHSDGGLPPLLPVSYTHLTLPTTD